MRTRASTGIARAIGLGRPDGSHGRGVALQNAHDSARDLTRLRKRTDRLDQLLGVHSSMVAAAPERLLDATPSITEEDW